MSWVGLFIDSKFEYEVLEIESSFIPGVYESIWAKVKVGKGRFKIIGNVHRPNSAPFADLPLAITNHNKIIQSPKNNKDHKDCDVHWTLNIVQVLNYCRIEHYVCVHYDETFIIFVHFTFLNGLKYFVPL